MNELETAHRRLKEKYLRARKKMKRLELLVKQAFPLIESAEQSCDLEYRMYYEQEYGGMVAWLQEAKEIVPEVIE